VHPARSSSRTSGTSLIASADAVDPSLVLNTNVVLSDKKRFLKAASAAIAAAFSKPEQYVAVCVTDKLDLLFGGSDAPCAIGCVYSIGEINQKNNAALTAAIADLLFAYGGIHDDRIYLNFFDVPPANCDCDCLEPSAASSSCCSSKLPHPSLVQSQVAGPGAPLQISPTDAIPTSSTHQGMRTSRVLIGVTASFACDDFREWGGTLNTCIKQCTYHRTYHRTYHQSVQRSLSVKVPKVTIHGRIFRRGSTPNTSVVHATT
jgi:phenylpyruvate tautomerase